VSTATTTLGDRIREARKAQALTQVALAARLDTAQGVVSMWETGMRQPTIKGLAAIATALDVTTDWLLGR
jgi:transcriptional regulator with XRE-family HTH domain